MPTYKYQAQTRDGQIINSSIEAVNLNLAIDSLTAKKLKIMEISPVRFNPLSFMDKYGKVKEDSIVLMSRQMVALVRSGLSIDRTLTVLHEQAEDQKLKPVLAAVLHDIRVGSTLSWALTKHPTVFNALFVSMVKVGETTGDLAGLLERLAAFLERDLSVKKKAKSALTYPALILVFCIAIVIGIFVFVLPPLLDTFAQMSAGGPLPLPTRIMFAIVNLTKNPYIITGLCMLVAYYMFYFKDYLKTPSGRFKFDNLKLTIPLIGDLNKKMLVAHFCRVLGTLLSTGITMTRGLEILMEFSDNEYFRLTVINQIYDSIKEGQNVSQIIQETHFFPDMVSNMIAVGESTGEMPTMLTRISEFYDKEVVYTLESVLSLIEPVMIAGMGVLVCFVLLSVFLPLYEVIMNMG